MVSFNRRPHVILLMADQLRSDILAPFGGRQCPTPKLDLLSKRSTIFQRHFTPAPTGVPARASLMTGVTPRQHGAIINGWAPSERHLATLKGPADLLPQHLVDAGYRVVHVGVQMLRSEPDIHSLLDEVEFIGPETPAAHLHQLRQRGLMLGDLDALRDPVVDFNQGRQFVFSASSPRAAVFPLREDLYYDCTLAQRMVEVIEKHSGSPDDRPLALLGMFWLPHPPLWVPQKWATLLDPHNLTLPPTVGRWFTGMPAAELANIAGQLGAHVSMEQWRTAWVVYMGMTALLDQCVGKVLAALDHKGMLGDSAVAFTANHGEMLGSHRLFQKGCMYEPVVRPPLIIKGPGQTAQRTVWDLTDHLDLTATLTDYAAAEPMPNAVGSSLRNFIEGHERTEPIRNYVFSSYDGNAGLGYHQRMIRSRTHKLIHHGSDTAELYDLVDDPHETVNLVGKPEAAEIESQLRKTLNAWMDSQNDPLVRC